MTVWGYETCGELPPLISAKEFRTLTGDRLASDDATLEAMLSSVSAAIRSYCGWHIAPRMACTYIGEPAGRILRIPAMGICLAKVKLLGRELSPAEYMWTAQGLVRFRHAMPDVWRSVEVEFLAGTDDLTELGAVVAQIASNALAASPGVAEEHAGQVGMSYNQTASGVSGGVSLLERDKDMLAPWRLTKV